MTKKEIETNKKKRDNFLYLLRRCGKKIAVSTIIKNNIYIEYQNNVWYVPYGKHAINQGTKEEFLNMVLTGKLKAKLY